jgi:hypothetical protein
MGFKMIRKRYRCPECARVFEYDHHPSIAADPVTACPYAGCVAAAETMEPALVMPHIAKTIGKNTDDLYRQMEDGAEFRSQIAQQVHGLSAEEASVIKMTNMRDNVREGDTTEMPVDNAITRQIAAAPAGQLGFVGGSGGVDGSAMAAGLQQSFLAGHHANAGLNAMTNLRASHGRNASRFIAAGTEGPRMPMANPTVTVDRPANETQMPGYRKRG